MSDDVDAFRVDGDGIQRRSGAGAFDRGGQSGRLGLEGALVFFPATFLHTGRDVLALYDPLKNHCCQRRGAPGVAILPVLRRWAVGLPVIAPYTAAVYPLLRGKLRPG